MNPLRWFQKRKQLIERSQYNSGYDYAAGALLRGDKTPFELDVEQVCENRSSFDYGMDAAIREVVHFGIAKDDRI